MRMAIIAAALFLAACSGGPTTASRTLDLPTAGGGADSPFAANRGTAPAPPAMSAASGGQSAPVEGVGPGGIDFGQWRSADPAVYGPAFEAQMAARFGDGASRAAARADLERNGFSCVERTGALECRIEIMEQQCAKDWYVAIEDGRARPRAGFDVMCLGAR